LQRHNAEKQLRRAMKKVKTFEQRKVARAIKQATDATIRAKKEADASTIKGMCLDKLAKEAYLLHSEKAFTKSSADELSANPRLDDIRLRMMKHTQIIEQWKQSCPESQRDPADLTQKKPKKKKEAKQPAADQEDAEAEGPPTERRTEVASEFVTMGGDETKGVKRKPGLNIEEAEEGFLRHDKKNRLGQRARRALAEKMFGGEAKHLGQQDGKAGNGKGGKGGAVGKGGKGGAKGKHGNAPKPQASAEEVHPSWAAKHAQTQAKFEGQKIKF